MPVGPDEASWPASEFGGKVVRDTGGIQPDRDPDGFLGHVELSAAERLRLMYRTGQDPDQPMDRTAPVIDEVTMTGLLPLAEQEHIARERGLLDKGVREGA